MLSTHRIELLEKKCSLFKGAESDGMRIISNEIQQVFKAYAKQLRVDHAKGKVDQIRDTRAKGFEKVEISEEARTLAANLPEMIQKAPTAKQDRVDEKSKRDPDSSEKDEKETDSSKASPDNNRSKEVVN